MTRLDRTLFVERYAGIYEHSAWVAERTFDNGNLPAFLDDSARDAAGELRDEAECQKLASAMAATLGSASDDEKMTLILAHPDLVGNAALAGELTDESTTEQSSAGLDKCTSDELARFQNANAAYRALFGFPFIMAVRGATRQRILAAFEQRLGNDTQTEFATALNEINRIALLRLEALIVR